MKQVQTLSIIFCLCSVISVSCAQEPSPGDFTLTAVPEFNEVALGSSYNLKVDLSSEAAGLEAWSFGLCIDESLQTVLSAKPGKDLNYVNFGNPPEYQKINIWPGEGVTETVIMDLQGGVMLAAISADNPVEVLNIDLKPDKSSTGKTITTSFCNDVGSPPVVTLFVVGDQGFEPGNLNPASIDVVRDPPTLIAFQKDVNNLPVNNGGVEPVVRLRSIFNLYGFSFGLKHDTNMVELESAEFLPFWSETMDREPDFKVLNTLPDGFTVGVVFDTTGPGDADDLQFFKSDNNNPSSPIVKTKYNTGPEAAEAVDSSENGMVSSYLVFTDELGDPPVDLLFNIDGDPEHKPNTRDTEILITAEAMNVAFIRGDINSDGRISISDAVKLLRYLFSGQNLGFNCLEALDCNNDIRVNAVGDTVEGSLDLSDVMYLLRFLFSGGQAPEAPYPDCGSVPDDEFFYGCLSFPGCSK